MARKQRAAILNQYLIPPAMNLPQGSEVIIIGAGLAGSAAANALVQAGATVTVLERETAVATQTSGHPAAVVFPMIAKMPTPLRDFFSAGYAAMLKKLSALQDDHGYPDWHQVGAYHLLVNDRLEQLWHHAETMDLPSDWVRTHDANTVASLTHGFIERPAFEYPTAGFVNPQTLTKALLEHPAIQLQLHREAISLSQLPGGWEVRTGKSSFRAKAVIFACGLEALRFEQANWLPLRCYRGQLAYIGAQDVANPVSKIICHEGYLVPQATGHYLAGATFHPEDRDPTLKNESHSRLVQQLQHWLPGFLQQEPSMQGRVAFRAQAPDHLPMVGPLPHRQATESQFQWLRQGQAPQGSSDVTYHQGLFTSLGHASRGTVSCWLAGTILASLIMGSSGAFPAPLLASVNPGRFLLRALRKGHHLPEPAMPLHTLPPRL